MRTEYDFFIIERDHLKEKKIFPFQLFVFNPIHKKFSMFLNGNRPLTKELETFLNYLLEKGAKIAILKNQRRTFLNAQQIQEADIPSLLARPLHELEKERIMNIKLKEIFDEKNGSFIFQNEFEQACSTDNFEKIIEYARIEISTFSVTHSPTVSLAISLSKSYLTQDNYLNRIVAVCYLFAKTKNILEADTLADIICGAFLSHIGLTQLPLKLMRIPVLSLSAKDKKLFEKHTILGHHLIKKGKLEISERCKKIVLDHHERDGGGGYPSMKGRESIEALSLLVGGVAYLFEFSSGKINGNKMPIKNIIIRMKNKSYLPGMEFNFGDDIFNGLINLINTDIINEENAA